MKRVPSIASPHVSSSSAIRGLRQTTSGFGWELRRRDLLKSLGLSLGCLPLLSAGQARALGSPTVKRLMIVMNTNGYRQEFWKPNLGSLSTQTLPDSCAPLEPHKDRLIFLPDMTQPAYGGGGHGSYVSCLASGPNDQKGEYRVPFSPTVDQIVGQPITQAASLPMTTLPLGIQIEGGNAGIFPSKRMCWKDRNSPVTPDENVYNAYKTVFAGGDRTPANAGAVKSLMAHRKSLLDYVGKSLDRFKGQLGTEDKQSIDSHLDSIRELEKQLSAPRADAGTCGAIDPGEPLDPKKSDNYPTLMKLSLDLMVAALRCDLTRVATLAPCDASGSNISFRWVPEARRGWHSMGHNPSSGGRDNKRYADKWMMGQFASLIERLKAIPDAGGTMLDSTVILWANHMHEGNNHNSQKTPWMLAGNLDGYFRTGQCAPSAGRPVNGVLYHLCHAMGVPVDHVGTPGFGKGWDGLTA